MPLTLYHGARACPFAAPPHPGTPARVFPGHFRQPSVSAGARSALLGGERPLRHPTACQSGFTIAARASSALAASSDPATPPPGTRVPTESDTIPARGLRLDGPQFVGRGRRRPRHARCAAPRLAARARHGPRRRGTGRSTISSSSTRSTTSPCNCRSRSKTFSCSRKCCSSVVCSRTRSTRSSISSSSPTTSRRVVQMNDAFAARVGARGRGDGSSAFRTGRPGDRAVGRRHRSRPPIGERHDAGRRSCAPGNSPTIVSAGSSPQR